MGCRPGRAGLIATNTYFGEELCQPESRVRPVAGQGELRQVRDADLNVQFEVDVFRIR